MVLAISLILCLALLLSILGVMMPELVLPIFKRLWDKHIFYISTNDQGR